MESSFDSVTKFQKLEYFLSILNRMLIGFVTIYVTFLSLQRLQHGDGVPWHALLCTIGFNLLMAEGILSYYRGNSSLISWFRKDKVILHIALQVVGSILGIAGMLIRMTIDEVHFQTLHGRLGLSALVLCLISLLSGLSAFQSIKLKMWIHPIFVKSLHGFLGILTYTMAMVCLVYGFDTHVFHMISNFDTDSSVNVILILKVATIGSLVITVYGPLGVGVKNLWNYFR